MATDLSICNDALARTGNDPIAAVTPTDGTAAGDIAAATYEQIARSELVRSRFKLPGKTAVLEAIADPDDVVAPWNYGYDLPADLIKLSTIKVDGVPIPYEQIGAVVFCDFDSEAVDIVAHYLWRLTTTVWSPEFVEGVTRRMEAVFLRGLNEDHAAARLRDTAADEQFQFARTSDSQAVTPRQPMGSPALRARVGYPALSATLRARRG